MNVQLQSSEITNLKHSIFEQSANLLTEALKKYATEQLLQRQSSAKRFESTHWVDFLGQGDIDIAGNEKPKPEDSLFSTAVSVNALLDIWTVAKDDKLSWIPSTPNSVRHTVRKAMNFLLENYSQLPKENAFFSGSIKGVEGVPFFYPANVRQHINGSIVDCTTSSRPDPSSIELLVAVRGLMSDDEFATQTEQAKLCYQRTVALEFSGYNCPSCIFPFWSSPSLTTGVTLLAASKFAALK